MNLSMTIRTEKDTFIKLFFDLGPTSCITFIRKAKIFSTGVQVVELKSFIASIVSTIDTLCPFVLDCHFSNLFPAFLNGIYQVLSTVYVLSLVPLEIHSLYSHPLYQLSYRGKL